MATKLTDKEWLTQKYIDECMPGQDIADELGVSVYSVWRALRKHGIKTRKRTSRYPILNDREWLYDQYIVQKKSMKTIAKEVGCSPGVIHSHLNAKGISTRPIRESVAIAGNQERRGANHPNWKGGRKELKTGYVYIYSPDHPYATKQGYVFEHRLIAEEKIGHYLTPYEVVHHMDGDRTNNDPDNLVVKKRHEHVSDHFKASHEVLELRQRAMNREEEKKLLLEKIEELEKQIKVENKGQTE